MVEEHRVEGRRFEQLSELAHNYITPPDGCNTFYDIVKSETIGELSQKIREGRAVLNRINQ